MWLAIAMLFAGLSRFRSVRLSSVDNRVWGDESRQLAEHHDASELDR